MSDVDDLYPNYPTGRPSDYTQELADEICHKLSEGTSLRKICLANDMPCKSTVFRWLRTNQSFLDQYTRAKQESADAHSEMVIDATEVEPERGEDGKIDASWVNLQRLKVDARKWTASKLNPKKYGDKQFTEHSGTLSLEQLMAQTVAPVKKEEDRS